MAKQIQIKENYQALLLEHIDWEKANLFRPGDNIAYIGIDADTLTRVRLGTKFRAYYAPNGSSLKQYRLVLFEVGTHFDKISKHSSRVYYELAKIDFAENIWGQQIYELQNS